MVSSKLAPVAVLCALLSASFAVASPRVHPNVHRALRQQGSVNLIVTMRDGTENVVASVKESGLVDRGQRTTKLVESLEQHAEQSQRGLKALLSQEAATAEPLFSEFKSFWITNQVYIKDATLPMLEQLLSEHSIAEITEEPVAHIPALIGETTAESASNLTTSAWGLLKTKVPDVWATGNTGKGVVVGTIDTGVIHTHEILRDSFRSSHNWFDPINNQMTPMDDNGHGTFTAGILVGANGVGVAPGATLITCKGCSSRSCPLSYLLSCAQFMTCPTDPAGENKDCSKAPDLVSNSWVNGLGDTTYLAAVNAWHAAGIIPIFGIGNDGKAGCSSARSPGDLPNVLSVGAVASNGSLALFSSQGPNESIKPELSAPGVDITSAWTPTDSSYRTASGTSAAAPHAAGIVALMLSANPALTYEQVRTKLITTTDTADLVSTGKVCGKIPDSVFPNNQFGYGRVNAPRAVSP